jgi:hypothetical protein
MNMLKLALGTGLLALMIPASLRADGCHFPKVGRVAAIPAQRALIVHRNGEETLVVESGLDSPSAELGWVIPLPSEPTALKSVSPGVLKTLTLCLQPKVVTEIPGLGLAFVGLLVAAGLFLRKSGHPDAGLILIVLPGFALFISAFTLSANLAASPRGVDGHPGIEIRQEVDVGDYRVTVLKADDAKALDAWLVSDGLAGLQPEARAIVDGYIRDRWCFSVAALKRKAGGSSVPHPLQMTFRTPEPVYPMRLTALARSTPAFELFVVSEERAGHPYLETEFCDRYVPSGSGDEAHARGVTHTQNLGHPALKSLLWNGCVLTKLSGHLTPEQMGEDLRFDRMPFAPARRTLFTQGAVRGLSVAVIFVGMTLGLLGCQLWWGNSRRILLWTTGLSLALALGVCAFWPSTQVMLSNRWISQMYPWEMEQVMKELMTAGDLRTDMDGAALESAVLKAWKDPQHPRRREGLNPFTGEPARMEDSPGNFRIWVEDGKLVGAVYDGIGRERKVEVPLEKGAE